VLRLCQIVFSTNRPEYLARTLKAQARLDTSCCAVDRILFDDFPKGRDDAAIRRLASDYGYREVYLHDRNMSIGATWRECWDVIRDRAYDYVWHQEDDVELLEPVSVVELIHALRLVPRASQVVLKRQPWYAHETPSEALDSDILCGRLRGEFTKAQVYFTPIASLYPMSRVRFDYYGWYRQHYPDEPIFHRANMNEALIGKALLEESGLVSLHLKNWRGGQLISHIGDYTIGRKLLPHEPGFNTFAHVDPEVRYSSRTGRVYEALT
jgi:hypothetical protein